MDLQTGTHHRCVATAGSGAVVESERLTAPTGKWTLSLSLGALSLVGERLLHTQEVTGSNPVAPTSLRDERREERRLSRRSRSRAGSRRRTRFLGARRLRLGMPATGFHYVYVLVSSQHPARHYVGCTTDLHSRLDQHNRGSVTHTAKYRPWRLEVAVAFRSKDKARAFETYLKSGSGREFSRRHF